MSRTRTLVVGAGIIGCNIALMAALQGSDVALIDRHVRLRGASQLNLGAIRLSGRAPGREMAMARYGRQRWETIARRVPDVGFRTCGSITLLRDDAEIDVARSYARMHPELDLDVIRGGDITRFEPAIVGRFPAAMVCLDDAAIRPAEAVPALVDYLLTAEAVDVRLGTELMAISETTGGIVARTSTGEIHADFIFICSGPDLPASLRSVTSDLPTRVVRLHAMELGSAMPVPNAIVTDGTAFAANPGFAEVCPPGTPFVDEWVAASSDAGDLLVGVGRTNEAITQLDTEREALLGARTAAAFGSSPPPRRRWSATMLDYDEGPYIHLQLSDSVNVITGLGTRGNTLAPSIALEVTAPLRGVRLDTSGGGFA